MHPMLFDGEFSVELELISLLELELDIEGEEVGEDDEVFSSASSLGYFLGLPLGRLTGITIMP